MTKAEKINALLGALNARVSMPKFEETKDPNRKRPRIIGSVELNPFGDNDVEFFTQALSVLVRSAVKEDIDEFNKMIEERNATKQLELELNHDQPASQPPPTPEQ